MVFAYHGLTKNLYDIARSNPKEFRYNMSGFPIMGDILRWDDNRRFWSDYMSNYGLSWDDVRYPTHLPGAGSLGRAGASAVMSGGFVSSNLARLYEPRGYVADPRPKRDFMYG